MRFARTPLLRGTTRTSARYTCGTIGDFWRMVFGAAGAPRVSRKGGNLGARGRAAAQRQDPIVSGLRRFLCKAVSRLVGGAWRAGRIPTGRGSRPRRVRDPSPFGRRSSCQRVGSRVQTVAGRPVRHVEEQPREGHPLESRASGPSLRQADRGPLRRGIPTLPRSVPRPKRTRGEES